MNAEQCNTRIPGDLSDRLKAASTRTGIPQSRIVVNGIRLELDRLERIDIAVKDAGLDLADRG